MCDLYGCTPCDSCDTAVEYGVCSICDERPTNGTGEPLRDKFDYEEEEEEVEEDNDYEDEDEDYEDYEDYDEEHGDED